MFAVFEGSSQVHLAHHRSPYLRVMLLVLLAHLIAFVLTPPFDFKPYQIPEDGVITVLPEIPDFLPPPPEDNPFPVNTVVGMDNDGDDDLLIPPTMYNNADEIPVTIIGHSETRSVDFHPFDEPPVLIHFEKPVYPRFSRESGIEGFVYIKVIIDRKGMVSSAIVLGSDVTAEMEQAALQAARGCTFKPGKQRGQPVPVAVMIPFEFRLSDCR